MKVGGAKLVPTGADFIAKKGLGRRPSIRSLPFLILAKIQSRSTHTHKDSFKKDYEECIAKGLKTTEQSETSTIECHFKKNSHNDF